VFDDGHAAPNALGSIRGVRMMAEANEALRRIPSVEKVLHAKPLSELASNWDRELVVATVREVLDAIRCGILENPDDEGAPGPEEVAAATAAILRNVWDERLRRVVNATGILLHTNLGRAPLSENAQDAVRQVLAGYSNLELGLSLGKRRSRLQRVSDMLVRLTGAPAALAVNNNAAAVFLSLHVLAGGRPVAVSRGELVEIGGSFRLPDIMETSGVELLEIGTTNRTRPSDYEKAVERGAALILKVHPSNYCVEGFVEEATIAEVADVARKASIPLVADIGSGALDQQPEDMRRGEPTVQQALREGADIVTASGDKLLGGPQAGLLWGRTDLVERIRSHPLARVVRLDKILLCALEATLAEVARGEAGWRRLPLRSMVARSLDDLEAVGSSLCAGLRQALGDEWEADVVHTEGALGGGSLPGEQLESRAVRLRHPIWKADDLARRLRTGDVPVIGRIIDDQVHLDLRTLLEEDVAELPRLVARAVREGETRGRHVEG
jgi:L-seryl-tRNA(Ser) seleniumtransferase